MPPRLRRRDRFRALVSKTPLSTLREVFGYTSFRGHQAEIVDHVVAGGDALVLMPTGSGKSLCYQIPAMLRDGTAVVVSPLIALMQDQVAALAELGVRAAFLNSTLSGDEAYDVEQRVRRGELDLLYVAPERLLTERCLRLLQSSRLALFAIDEVHCVSEWGHDFRPEYHKLSVLKERFPAVPRVALTATADALTRAEIITRMEMKNARLFISSFNRPNIRYRVVEKDSAREQLLDFIRADHAGDAGIVYCLSRKSVDDTAHYLCNKGVTALPYHAGMESADRRKNQRSFQSGDGVVMVATIAFGMGIDKPDVRFVAHLDLPKSIEGYYQETGRAGRDGLPADAWMAYGLQDVVQLRRMIDENAATDSHKRVQTSKLDAMLGLCETSSCRRVLLLNYFGEAADACGNCDNCLEPPASFDATIAVQQLLSCIARMDQMFGALHVIDVLRGVENDKIFQWRHTELSTFGLGKDRSVQEWRAIIRQCVALELLRVDHERFGALKLAMGARAVLKGERKITLREWKKEKKTAKRRGRKDAVVAIASGDGESDELYESLRNWRLDAARAHGVPAYVIFHDSTLREIAQHRPKSLDALRNVSGVGVRKLEAYGADIVRLVAGVDQGGAVARDTRRLGIAGRHLAD
jgi:ATP-dependent DNA helicase RecQ